MEKNKDKKKEMKQKNMGKEREPFSIMTLPILLVLGLVPLITRMVTLDSYSGKFLYGAEVGKNYDAFLYGKGVVLLVLAGLMLALLIVSWFLDREWPKLGLAFIPLAVYAVFVLASSLHSEYQEFALNGAEDSYQSVFILLAYCVLTIYTYVMVRSEKSVEQIFTWWTIGIALLILLGITQLYFKDFWSTWLGRHIMLARKDWGMSLKFRFEAGRVYMSQYNPNYVGGLAVMIILSFGTLALLGKGKKRWLFGLVAAGMLLCLLGSQSKNGIMALIVSAVLLLVFLRKRIRKHWLSVSIVCVILVSSVIGIDLARDHFLFNAIKGTWKTLTTQEKTGDDEKSRLEDIQTTDDGVIVYYNGDELHMQCKYDSEKNAMAFIITDQDENEIVYTDEGDDKIYELADERFKNITFRTAKQGDVVCFELNIGGTWWTFTNELGDGSYYYYAPAGLYTKIDKAESVLFTNKGSLGSSRGYIWARSIPLLKETVFLGKGADNYVMYFPQADYVEAWKNGYHTKSITTPHNMYLQFGIDFGVIALIAFLAFCGIYFAGCVKLYWKNNFDSFLSQAGIAICLAVFAYLLTGLLNDMMVCVAPVFWCLIGLGLAVNRMYRKEREE